MVLIVAFPIPRDYLLQTQVFQRGTLITIQTIIKIRLILINFIKAEFIITTTTNFHTQICR